jgi:serine/threonine protein phosphatase 1
LIISQPGVKADDLVYLRGGQEEMLQKLTQIQFANNPTDVLLWVLSKGLSTTLKSYGLCPHDGITAAQEGVMSLTRWTSEIRQAIKRRPGHETFFTHLKRAAYVPEKYDCPVLLVHAGIDPRRTLAEQGDNFWWSGQKFNEITLPYKPFHKVIRGYDPNHQGVNLNCVTATIDGGCGFGGDLVCAGFNHEGSVFDIIQN